MPQMLMKHDHDPAQVIKDKVGDLSEIEIFGNSVLVGIYIRPTKTASGLYIPDQVRKEDEYQGKVGLVLKVGPEAFVSDRHRDFGGLTVSPGDWVYFKSSDGWPIVFNQAEGLCRLIDDIEIRGRISQPDIAW